MYKVSKETYEKVMKACREQCVLCGRTYPLQLHHVMRKGKVLNRRANKLRHVMYELPLERSTQEFKEIPTDTSGNMQKII